MDVHKYKKRVLSLTIGSTESCLLCLLVFLLMCGDTHQYSWGIMTSWTVGQTITGNNIRTIQVRTKHECAFHCVADDTCVAAAVFCQSPMVTGTVDCHLQHVTPVSTQNNSDMCYSVVRSRGESAAAAQPVTGVTTAAPPVLTTTTTTTMTTVPTTLVTAVSQMTIRAGIGNLLNMCSSSSSTDIALITDGGVYIYDDMASLTTGACSGPLLLTTVFSGYSSSQSLPAPSNIICLMVYQNNEIDMLDNYQVWRWQAQSGNLWSQSSQSFPKSISTRLGVSFANTPPINSDWCVNRDRNGRQDVFFYNSGMLHFYSSQSPYMDSFAPSTTGKSYNGYNLNPWTNLPSEPVVAVISLTSGSDDFVMIGQSRQLYRYQMDHLTNSNDPPITVTTLGALVL